jgi:hypothetical protein
LTASFAPWHSVATVDERTYLEMTDAVARRGVPAFFNGPVEQYPALQARWNLARDGRVWGSLAPAFPYLASPFLRLGGVRLLIRLNIALLALIALGTFALARELSGDQMTSAVAACLSLVGIPVWTASFGVSAYSLAIVSIVWAAYFASRALDPASPRSAFHALTAGGLAALGTAAHLLIFPMMVGLVMAMALRDRELGLRAAAGTAPAVLLLAVINRLRFGSWNPVSDGPCAWLGCPESGVDPQSMGQILAFGWPVAVWLTLTALLAWLTRHSRPLQIAALLISLAVLLPPSRLQEAAVSYAMMTWAFLVDASGLEMGGEFRATADGFGNFVGPHVIKAALQGSPILALAVLGLAGLKRRARPVVVLPAAALLLALVLRGNMEPDFALGHSFLNLRYVMPAAPLLAVLAVAAVRDLPWRVVHLVIGGALVLGLLAWWLPVQHDFSPLRRLALLRASLVTAILCFFSVLIVRSSAPSGWKRVAAWATTAALAFSVGVTLGVDLPATVRYRSGADAAVDRLAGVTPERFALVGFDNELDPALTLGAQRDIEYLDLGELESVAEARPMILWWHSRGRPVFVIFPPGEAPGSPWLNLALEPVDPAVGLVRVVEPNGGDAGHPSDPAA